MSDLAAIVCIAFDHRAPTEGLQQFKKCICSCKFVETAMEVSGTFDLIVQGRCSSLTEYNENMDRIRPQLAMFVKRIETNFIGKRIERATADNDNCLWLPCHGGRRRVEAHLIDKVIAEGDYMRVHLTDWNCLVHHTMTKIKEQLGEEFISLHRSCLVRITFIDRLVTEDRRWKARLKDGTHVCVAKSHVNEVLRLIQGDSSKRGVRKSKVDHFVDEGRPVNEMIMSLEV
jgi:hypothetical protein